MKKFRIIKSYDENTNTEIATVVHDNETLVESPIVPLVEPIIETPLVEELPEEETTTL